MKRTPIKILAVKIIAMILTVSLILSLELDIRKVSAGDGLVISTDSIATDNYGSFAFDGVWYLITKKPAGAVNGQVYASGCVPGTTKLVIPAQVKYNSKKYDVIGINDTGFEFNETITSLEVKSGVKYIGRDAFWGCTNLAKVSLADSIDEIGRTAFGRCTALKQINIPDSLKTIPEGFASCTALKEIKLGKNVTTIEREAFGGCGSLKTVKFNKKLKTIGQMAFTGCKSLESAKLPSSLKTIMDSAFMECDSLKSVSIPKKVKEIPEGCFNNCDELKKVKLPKGIKKIGCGAFNVCTNLETVTGTNLNLTVVESSAFNGCKKLRSVNIQNVTEIGEWAFYGTALTTVKLSDKLKTIGEKAFAYSSLEKIVIPGSVKVIENETFSNCRNLQEVVFKHGVERLEGRVFDWCDKLTDISFPDTIDYITADAVVDTGWFALAQGQFPHQKDDGRVLYDYSKDGKYDYSKRPDAVNINDICIWADHSKVEYVDSLWRTSKSSSLSFPAGTRVIACSIRTFDLDENIEKIVIPEGVEILAATISLGTDSSSDKTVDLILPSSLKILEGSIGGGKFKSITLPENLEALGARVFSGAKSLETVKFAGKKLKEISNGVFSSTSSLKSIEIPEGVESIGDYAFDSSGITQVSIPDTVSSIGKMAFFSCPIEKVTLPKKLEAIGESAFRNTKLTKIDLPNSIRTIGLSAFEGTSIKKFRLPDKFEIEKDFIFDPTITVVVTRNSKAHKALEVFMNHYGSDFWTVEYLD